MIKWNATKEDMVLIDKIAKRGFKIMMKWYCKKIDLEMDITATHLNGCPLNLNKLLQADDFDFYHDIQGIYRHLDRETGELRDCFLPRCAQPELKKVAA
jgi:hypothetical protein